MTSKGAALALLLCAACPAQTTSSSGPPPPRGQSIDSYLAIDAAPEAPEVPTGEPRPTDAVVLHAIDIGQGTAALVELPCGAVLIDTGGEKNDQFDSWPALRDYLDEFFQRRRDLDRTFDLLVVTHPHIDHTRNLEAVLERYEVENIVDNGAAEGDIGVKPQNEMHEWLERRGKEIGHRDVLAADVEPPGMTGPVIDPIGGCERSQIDPVLTALWGGEEELEVGNDPNNNSVVLRVEFGSTSLLLAGDVERLAIAKLTKRFRKHPEVLDADVFLVPHHGSRNSTSEHFIEAVTPKVAVITAGPYYRNEDWTARRFGHPHRTAINHLLDPEHGVSMRRESPIDVHVGVRGAWKDTPSEFEERTIERAIYATGWDGSVRVTAEADGDLTVKTGL